METARKRSLARPGSDFWHGFERAHLAGCATLTSVSKEASHLRQLLRSAYERLGRHTDSLLAEREGLIRGTLSVRARVCGDPRCRCTRGALHTSKCLQATVGGRTRQVHVPKGDEVEVAAAVERYQRWRKTRAEIVALEAEYLRVIDRLADALLASYPPNNPIPPVRKRSRKNGTDGRES